MESLWKLTGRMECIDLGNEFFLIRFSIVEDRAKVLKGGPWFVGGHYLSIRRWEPNFDAKTTKLSAVAVWIRLPGLPIEYYEPSVLKDIGLAIGPVLRIDTQIAMEARGRFARLCVQVNFDKPIIKLIKIGGVRQPVQYEGINALCFSCGHVGHKTEGCSYRTKSLNPTKETMRPDLGVSKEIQHLSDETKGSQLRADHTNLSLSRERSTLKQKIQKEKNLRRGQQHKKSQAETDGSKAIRLKAYSEWKVTNSRPSGSSSPLTFGSDPADMARIGMEFKGFCAGSSEEANSAPMEKSVLADAKE
ncbi:hypothetical protein SO802_003383 [Lithocarpus litseifolius]|uniref:CCHC-type domain-containing protein n=1 Tax=Lithocarpus litseifolius TaxID=425828 RepID=A0AAW2E3R1_9ROSI